jgi:predicted esterase
VQQTDDLGFIHKWVPAESVVSDPVTLLLLLGTGGNENTLLPVGKELWPGVASALYRKHRRDPLVVPSINSGVNFPRKSRVSPQCPACRTEGLGQGEL